jgi:cytochrome c-type biogenesis protein CcmH
MNRLRRLLSAVCLLGMINGAHAVAPDEVLKDPALEARARAISAGLRCLVCQNQSIDESEAPVAKDLRLLIRERISNGKSDAEVVDYVVSRYGDYVLLKPRFGPATYLLWLAPFALVLAGIMLGFWRRSGGGQQSDTMTEAEKAELEALLRK